MRDYRTRIQREQAERIIRQLMDMEYDVEIKQGCLQDNYFITIGKSTLRLGRVKFRKYFIIVEKYINEWNSCLEMILTDNEELFYSLLEKYSE